MNSLNTYRVSLSLCRSNEESGVNTYFLDISDEEAIFSAVKFARGRMDAFNCIDGVENRLGYLEVQKIQHPIVGTGGQLSHSQVELLYIWKEGMRHFQHRSIKKVPKIRETFSRDELMPCQVTGKIFDGD